MFTSSHDSINQGERRTRLLTHKDPPPVLQQIFLIKSLPPNGSTICPTALLYVINGHERIRLGNQLESIKQKCANTGD